MQTGFVGGHGRQTLISQVGSEATQGDSVDFSGFDTTKFSRLTGLLIADSGDLTFRWRQGVESGTWLVTSTTVVGTVGVVFDQLNYGKFTDFSFTVINSTSTFNLLILGEPLR